MAAVTARLRAAGCVYAEEEAELLVAEAGSTRDLEAKLQRRLLGEPLEQVLGWAALAGLRLVVEPGVFVPRRRTELLVREAARRVRAGDVVVDLCCGCGAVAVALGAEVPGLELHAVDVDPVAVRCARRNLSSRDHVHCGDLFSPLPDRLRGRVDLVVASPPYVPTRAVSLMPREARLHEPSEALDGGDDGLAVHRRLLARAVDWLAPGGHVLLECAEDQASALEALVEAGQLHPDRAIDQTTGGVVVAGSASGDRPRVSVH